MWNPAHSQTSRTTKYYIRVSWALNDTFGKCFRRYVFFFFFVSPSKAHTGLIEIHLTGLRTETNACWFCDHVFWPQHLPIKYVSIERHTPVKSFSELAGTLGVYLFFINNNWIALAIIILLVLRIMRIPKIKHRNKRVVRYTQQNVILSSLYAADVWKGEHA